MHATDKSRSFAQPHAISSRSGFFTLVLLGDFVAFSISRNFYVSHKFQGGELYFFMWRHDFEL